MRLPSGSQFMLFIQLRENKTLKSNYKKKMYIWNAMTTIP